MASKRVDRLNAAARRGIIAFLCASLPVAKGPVLHEKMSEVDGRAKTEPLKLILLPDA